FLGRSVVSLVTWSGAETCRPALGGLPASTGSPGPQSPLSLAVVPGGQQHEVPVAYPGAGRNVVRYHRTQRRWRPRFHWPEATVRWRAGGGRRGDGTLITSVAGVSLPVH